MSLNLYFKTGQFTSNEQLASYIYNALLKEGVVSRPPKNEDYMYSIKSLIDGETVIFYMGKNDEESEPSLWQIWPEQQLPLLKRILGKSKKAAEVKAKSIAEAIIRQIVGVSSVQWDI